MTFRVYLRYPKSDATKKNISDQTTTESRAVAEFAFAELKMRTDLNGQDVIVAFTENQKQLAVHDFSKLPPAG